MQAMILEHPAPVAEGPLKLRDLPLPEPGPGQILVRVCACGVCHTDLHTVEGDLDLPKLPLVPGHQVVGRVEQLGPDVTTFGLGDRVGLAWLHQSCGQCDFCATDRENLCPSARFTGLHVNGGYAQYLTAPAEFAYPIPRFYADHQAAPLLCAGIIGYRALRLSRIQPGGRLGLYGFGASAHLGRGRDVDYSTPPAQIPACGTTAPGSCLGSKRADDPKGKDAVFAAQGAIGLTIDINVVD